MSLSSEYCDERKRISIEQMFRTYLERSSRSLLSKVDELIGAIGTSDDHEASTTDTAMVHANDTDTEDCADQLCSRPCQSIALRCVVMDGEELGTDSIGSIASIFDQVDTYTTAYGALGGSRPKLVGFLILLSPSLLLVREDGGQG